MPFDSLGWEARFRSWLLERRVVGDDRAPFLVHWVSRFLRSCPGERPWADSLAVEGFLEDGYDIRTIQELLCHANVRTTMIYTHVAVMHRLGVRSPLDSPT